MSKDKEEQAQSIGIIACIVQVVFAIIFLPKIISKIPETKEICTTPTWRIDRMLAGDIDTKTTNQEAARKMAGSNRIYLEEYRDWETDRKSTRLNSSHRSLSRMPSSA